MHRLFGTAFICAALILALGSNAAYAVGDLQKYGVEFRGGFGIYDMGDVIPGVQTMQRSLSRAGLPNTLSEVDNGFSGGLSFLVRPTRHTMWEVGYNALLDVDNTVETTPDTASGQILMHANEFFFKGHLVATLTDALLLDFGAGLAYYNTELQVQDNLARRYNYDAVGRSWGLLGSVGLEYLVTQRLGIAAQGGGRLSTANNFAYETGSGTRTNLTVIGGNRSMEVNLTGIYAQLGFRIYFDRVTKPVDFTR